MEISSEKALEEFNTLNLEYCGVCNHFSIIGDIFCFRCVQPPCWKLMCDSNGRPKDKHTTQLYYIVRSTFVKQYRKEVAQLISEGRATKTPKTNTWIRLHDINRGIFF